MADLPDDLLHRAIHGDHPALARLLEQSIVPLRRRLQPLLPQRCQGVFSIDDLLQITFTDVFLSIHRFEPRGDGAFAAWIATLARRNLQDAIRLYDAEKRGGRRLHDLLGQCRSSQLLKLVTSSATPSRQAIRDEAGAALQQALETLPDLHRTIVRLVDLDGCPVARVAGMVERSIGAVYMLRARAHRWLADILVGSHLSASGASSRFFHNRA